MQKLDSLESLQMIKQSKLNTVEHSAMQYHALFVGKEQVLENIPDSGLRWQGEHQHNHSHNAHPGAESRH